MHGEERKAGRSQRSLPLAGCRFSRTAKLLLDFEPPCHVTGNMTLRDCISGIGPGPSASAWQEVGQARVAPIRSFATLLARHPDFAIS